MSVVRNTATRRSINQSSHPYSPRASKISPWNISSILNFINPLRFRFSADNQSKPFFDVDSEEVSYSVSDSVAADRLSKRGEKILEELGVDSTHKPALCSLSASRGDHIMPPRFLNSRPDHENRFPRSNSHFVITPSPEININDEAMKNSVTEKTGSSIPDIEVEGIYSLLEMNITAEKHVPFRFTSNATSTSREIFPAFNSDANSDNSFTVVTDPLQPPPRRTLTKNPNGSYRWLGGGSAKVPRSRSGYHSPAFGPPRSASKLSGEREVLEDVCPDTKRRKINQDVEISIASLKDTGVKTINGISKERILQPHSPISYGFVMKESSDQSSGLNNTPKAARMEGSPLLRLNDNYAHTYSLIRSSQPHAASIIPSPLRQAWLGPTPAYSTTLSPQKPTQAASFMANLIKEVTPPKRPDLSNPYQMKIPGGRAGPQTRSKFVRKVRTARAHTLDSNIKNSIFKSVEKESLKQLSPRAIIEATLPKSYKRSHPAVVEEKTIIFVNNVGSLYPATSVSTDIAKLSRSELNATLIIDAFEGEKKIDLPYEKEKNCLAELKESVDVFDQSVKSDGQNDYADMNKGNPLKYPQTLSPHVSTDDGSIAMVSPTIPVNRGILSTFKATSVPKEPSKLRYSYKPEGCASNSCRPVPTDETPVASEILSECNKVPTFGKGHMDTRETILLLPMESLPLFDFTVPVNSPSDPNIFRTARDNAVLLSESSLPRFELTAQTKGSIHPPVIKSFD